MAYYRCGGANHYDEGYSAGYTNGYNKGKSDQRDKGYTDGTFTLSSDNVWNRTVTIPGISRVDAIVSAYLTDVYDGGRHGFQNIEIVSGANVHYDVSGAFTADWDVTIVGRQYHTIE